MNPHLRPVPGRGLKAQPPEPDTRFRVLRLGKSRKAFRLETPFWRALEIIAQERGGTLEDEIRAKLDRVPDGANQSSALRVGAIEDMIAFWQGAEGRAARLQWSHVLEASPSPAFAVTEAGQVICANSALARAIRGHRLAPDGGPIEIAVELPAQAAAEALRTDGQVLTTALFRSGPFRFSARVRLAGHADGARANGVVIGFLDAG